MSGFQFGTTNTPNVAPFGSTNTPNTSFNIKTPSFGTPSTVGIGLGTQSTAPAFGTGNLAFGTATPTANTSFGKPTTLVPGTTLFGTPAASTPNTNLFGKLTAPTTNLFGTPNAAPASSGFFGGTNTAPGTGLFGGSNATTQSTLTTTPAFGATPIASTGPKLGLFATPAPSAATAPTFLFPGTSTSGFSFGPAATTTTTAANQITPSTGLPFGLGGTTSFNLTAKQPAPTNVGLGGIAPVQEKSGTATTGKTELVPKEQPLPNELQQTVQNFKEFVKKQKAYSSDVARCSIKEFKKVESEIDLATNLLNEVEKQLQNNRSVAEKLKNDTAKVLQNVEIAQRTFDTPPGLQYDNTGPLNFFLELADTFERDMYALKLQIDNTDKYVKNLGKHSPLNSQDLTNGMRKLHETFVALAGRLQSVHGEVETQKEQYLNLRKYMFNDETNVFDKSLPQNDIMTIENNNMNDLRSKSVPSGPTPFNSFMNSSVVQQVQAQNPQPPPPPYAATNQIGLVQRQQSGATFGNATTNFGQSVGMFNTSNIATTTTTTSSSSSNDFQLQNPPIGSKRKQ